MTVWPLPRIEFQELSSLRETRPTALLTGHRAWETVSSLMELPLVVQAEPHKAEHQYFDMLAQGLPPEVEVVYGVGGGLACDCAKYIGWARNLHTVLIPTVLSADGFFTALAAVREAGSVHYITTGPADEIIIDWDVIRVSPPHLRGAGIIELLTIVTGLLDWRLADGAGRLTPETAYSPWAAALAAGIAQQAFRIAADVGKGNVDALRNLLDLMCIEVQMTNQIGHNRPQEGSEQYFAYAVEGRAGDGKPVPYADLVGPGLLIAAALHGQDPRPLRATLESAGIRLNRINPDDITGTVGILPQYVVKHDLPYSILNDLDLTSERVTNLLATTGLDNAGQWVAR
jgi:glycerol-1-phosphate dehydrogenase [NAD(P)+]